MTLHRIARARLVLALPIAGLALSLAACAPSRPAVADVAEGLHTIFQADEKLTDKQKALYTDEATTCFAEKLVESDVSDATLAAIARGDDEPQTVADRDLTVILIKDHSKECLGS